MQPVNLIILLLCTQLLHAQLLIKNVNVVDVDKKKILTGLAVLVSGDKIIAINKEKTIKLPEGTQVIDAAGKYLVPGFTDAHIHFFQSGGLYARPDAIDLRKYRPYAEEIKWVHNHMEDFLRRYLSVGITSVIDVGATYNLLRQRDSFTTKNYAPLIRITGPLLTTYVPEVYKNLGNDSPFEAMLTEEGTQKSVQEQLKLNPDFIKIWYIVTDKDVENGARKNLALVKAAIDEAHKNNKRVAVHATERITAQLAVEAGADFLVHSVDDEIVPDAFVKLLKEKKTVLCPTLVVAGNYDKVLGDTYHFTTDELKITHPEQAGTIIDYPLPDTALANRYIQFLKNPAQHQKQRHTDSVMAVNLKKLIDGGVIIATGTDAGNIGTQHAASYFEELKAMQAAGLNAWQILEASTINGAKAMGQDKEWGSIAQNKLANMLLLSANPLDSLPNWRKVEWVMNRGVLFHPDSLITISPVDLVQQQLNAYNAHDLEAFLAPYAEDVEIYQFPNTLLSKGKEQMRKDYVFITKVPKLFCRLQNRIVQGNMVIDHEEVSGFGPKPLHAVAIYLIEKGKISKVYFQQ